MATFHFDLVSPEKLAFSGEVDQVDVPGSEGDFGVLAGHAPLIALLRPGVMTVYAGGQQTKLVVLGGFADAHLASLTEAELDDLERWLEVPDQQIFAWVNGMEMTPQEFDTALFRRLRDFHRKEKA